MKQKLSVIMATYRDNPEFLEKCVDSILNQTFCNFEFIIVVEPKETNISFLEKTAKLDNRVKVLENASRVGISASRNRAIRESSGEYIALIDGDDYCDLSRFEKQLEFLENNSDISVVGSNMYLVDESNVIIGERIYPELHKDIQSYFLITMAVANPTVMTRKKDMEDAGLFDAGFPKAEDLDLWLRFLALNKKMYNIQENLVYYRMLANHYEKRSSLHYKSNYIARKRHSRFIWPLHIRFFSLFFYFFISHIPDGLLCRLVNLKISYKLKNK
mgnify:CR=1 FL=1